MVNAIRQYASSIITFRHSAHLSKRASKRRVMSADHFVNKQSYRKPVSYHDQRIYIKLSLVI